MQRSGYALLIFLCLSLHVFGQDSLLFTNGSILRVSLLEISPKVIKYTKADSLSRPIFGVLKSSVAEIYYRDGSREVLGSVDMRLKYQDSIAVAYAGRPAEELFRLGEMDAEESFKGKGAFIGTFVASALLPPAGLITGIAVSAKSPDLSKTQANKALLEKPSYKAGYLKQARSTKLGSALGGFIMGTAISAITILILTR